jgi:nucleotide-binding universal stress UspA family protein
MFKRILVAYDGSDGALAALRLGIDLAQGRDADLRSISVEEHLPRYAASIDEVKGAKEQIDEHFRALTKQARDAATLEGVELETVVRRGHEVKEIVGFAREEKCDLLMLGWHGHSRVYERIIGSTSLSVARLAPCSVLIVRSAALSGTGLERIKRILVGIDGSPLGRLAFHAALDLAIFWEAAVVGVTVSEVSPLARPEPVDSTYVQQLKAAAAEHARVAGVVFEHVTRSGHAARSLRDHARDAGADLIVVGATGLEHPWSPTIGGTASSVAGEAPCSVLLVRSPQSILHVRDVMVRGVSAVAADAPLAEVVELLLRRNVKALPVVDARRHVLGIITGGDLLDRGGLDLRLSVKQELGTEILRERLRVLAESRKSARDVMTRHVRTIDAETDLVTVIRLMAAHRVKRLPVVNRDRELVGIVSRADVLRAIAALPGSVEPVEGALPAVARTVADAATTQVPIMPAEASAEEARDPLDDAVPRQATRRRRRDRPLPRTRGPARSPAAARPAILREFARSTDRRRAASLEADYAPRLPPVKVFQKPRRASAVKPAPA